MENAEILTAFQARRAHYDIYLQANGIQLYTCPGCGFPTLIKRNNLDICNICSWEDDGQDDNIENIFSELLVTGITISGPDLIDNRINIGRILETNAELINGDVDFDSARVLKTIAFYQQRKEEINDRITGDEYLQDHIWMEWKEVKKDLLMALVVPKA